MTNKKKIVLLLAFLSLIFCLSATASTYAKYFTKTESSIGSNIKKWDIKVNKETIKNGYELENIITAYFDKSEHIAENQIAPGSEGYFIIELDYSNVELSFDYTISIDKNEELKDIKIYKLEIDGNEVISDNPSEISNHIDINDVSDTTKIKEVKVFIHWNDDEENGAVMNDEEDTNITLENNTINFGIKINLTQSES